MRNPFKSRKQARPLPVSSIMQEAADRYREATGYYPPEIEANRFVLRLTHMQLTRISELFEADKAMTELLEANYVDPRVERD